MMNLCEDKEVQKAARRFIRWCKDSGEYFKAHVANGSFRGHSSAKRGEMNEAFLAGVTVGLCGLGKNAYVVEYNLSQYVIFGSREGVLEKLKTARANFKAAQVVEG